MPMHSVSKNIAALVPIVMVAGDRCCVQPSRDIYELLVATLSSHEQFNMEFAKNANGGRKLPIRGRLLKLQK